MQRYSARKGVAYLTHSRCSSLSASTFPCIREEKRVTAIVDVVHALGGETFQNKDLEIGSWINVVGYICWEQDKRLRRHRRKSNIEDQTIADSRTVSRGDEFLKVQALMIWYAGSLRLDVYEQAVRMRMESEG